MLSHGRASATYTLRHMCAKSSSAHLLCVCLLTCCIHSVWGAYVYQCCNKIYDPDADEPDTTKCHVGYKDFAGDDYIGGFPKMQCCGAGSAYAGHLVFGRNLWFWCQTCPECTYVEWQYFEDFQGSRQVCMASKPCGPGTSGSCEGDCRLCDAGKANPYSDHWCSDCVKGKYANAQGKSDCDACPAGKYSDITGRNTECDVCPGATQSAAGATTCTGCGAGKQPNADKSGCDSCTAGKKSAGNAFCTDCDAGKLANSDKSGCDDCGPGKYATSPTWSNCVACDPGYASVNTANSACTKCGAGKFANLGVNALGSTLCQLCDTNFYAREPGTTAYGNQKCTTCDVGKYTQCAACSPLSGASECRTHQEFCVRDTNYCGASSTNPQCHCCSGQFLQVDNGVRKCLSCPVTLYMDENAHTNDACKTCVEGRYPTSMPGADWPSAVVQVGLGLPNHGAIECVGTLAAVSCSGCSAGKYKDSAGSGLCTGCPVAQFSVKIGVSTCDNCQPGKYSDVTGVTVCINCPAGKSSLQKSSRLSECIFCTEGKYSPVPGSLCSTCGKGRYAGLL